MSIELPGYKSAAETAEPLIRSAITADDLLRYAKEHWDDVDVRVNAVRVLKSTVDYATMILNILDHAESGRVDFSRLIGLGEGSANDAGAILEGYTKRSVPLYFQFQVEHLVARLNAALGLPLRSFEEAMRALLTHIGASRPVRRSAEAFVLSLIRNSMHNNGFHRRSTRRISIDGYTFVFRENRRVRQAGWHHIVCAITAELRTIGIVLEAPDVHKLRRVVDPFARSVELYGA